jgi:hypothetical protein
MTVYAGRIQMISASSNPNVTRIFDPYGETEGLVIGDIVDGVISDCIVKRIVTLSPAPTASNMVIATCKTSTIDITVNDSLIVGCTGNSLMVIGDRNDVVGYKSSDCSLGDGVYGISLIGNYNSVSNSSVRKTDFGPSGSTGVSCLNVDGNYNQVIDTELDGNTSGDYNVVVAEFSTGTKLLNLGVVNSAGLSRYSVFEETCFASETKEWGKGGLVEASTSVVLRAWRDALIIHAYFNLGTAGSTDTDVDLLLNGSIIGSATVAAYATEGSVQLSTEINPGDLLTVEVTTAGTDAVDLSAQIGLI